jgi:hypothetical protein
MSTPEDLDRLAEAVDSLVAALETLTTFEGSSHTLAKTQVGLAMAPHISEARQALDRMRSR